MPIIHDYAGHVVEFNGKRFALAPLRQQQVWPVATPGVDGFYQPRKNGTMFMDGSRNPRVFLVDNRYGEQFFVSASILEDGRVWYSYSLSSKDEKFLGVKDLGFLAIKELARDICRQMKARRGRRLATVTVEPPIGAEKQS